MAINSLQVPCLSSNSGWAHLAETTKSWQSAIALQEGILVAATYFSRDLSLTAPSLLGAGQPLAMCDIVCCNTYQ